MSTSLRWGLFLCIAGCGDDEGAGPSVSGPLPEPATREYRDCQEDADCVFANNGCCDCANGGEEIAVSTARLADFEARFDCEGVACTEMARSPACGCGIASCVEGLCTYSLEGPDCDDVSIVCGQDLGLTVDDATVLDDAGLPHTWDVESDGDRATASWTGSCGDECEETREVAFQDAYEECPRFDFARIVHSDCTAEGCVESSEWAVNGSLALQSWDIATGPIAGRLTSEIDISFYWPP